VNTAAIRAITRSTRRCMRITHLIFSLFDDLREPIAKREPERPKKPTRSKSGKI
jgi:hypothetical protein